MEALLGPKTEEDLKPPEKKTKAKAPPKVGVLRRGGEEHGRDAATGVEGCFQVFG